KGAHDLSQHVAYVCFQPVLPLRVALRRKVEQRATEAPKIARRIINGKIHRRLRRALMRRRLTIQITGTVGLEAEPDIVEETVDARVVDAQPITREVAGHVGGDA